MRRVELVPADVAEAVFAVLEDPDGLVEELERGETTLIHGDLKFGNVGLMNDRVVFVDWSDRVGVAPPAVEFAWNLAINATRIDATREEIIEDWNSLYGPRHEERTLRLALLGGLVQLGWNKAWQVVRDPDPAARERERADLAWWVATARAALEPWSPR